MSLRLIEIIVPIQESEELSHLLHEENVIGLWTAELREERMITRILVPMEKTEQVTDLVIHRFGSITGFRLMLFAVEATLPQLEEMVEQASEEPIDEETSEAALERISREELYQDITQGARFTNIYLVTVVLSTVVAAVGLIQDSVTIIIGVMVAVALLPPLVTTGLLAGAGYYTLAGNSLLLFTTNIIGLNLAGVVTFLIQKVRPRTHGETRKAKKVSWMAILIWLLLIGILLTLIFVFGQE